MIWRLSAFQKILKHCLLAGGQDCNSGTNAFTNSYSCHKHCVNRTMLGQYDHIVCKIVQYCGIKKYSNQYND